ncbi:hypothetical protein NIES4075_35500 [Tolypothrix sp. NIES-4075]|uniref:hypothetical protein n=1 Tax=Tolypothrix sp. NIES-4075 TaxID=2005459 RepID=UPI000B5CBBA7|nr:hypothetical protein [Tolypothrix sp. NIES-4075]GAX42548.1 hypothetical protein NIES4075_35500 [Tolypothrix sp. NIES-4075]
MSSVQHLQRRREELQQQYDLLSEKIKRLRNDSAIEAGTLVAFQLDKEIERFEAERDRNGKALKIPWLAVADLLLSSLCDEVGYELYEMETEVRNALLKKLKVNPRVN